jgi:hypothetical protein
MSGEQLAKARGLAADKGFPDVRFEKGYIEDVPAGTGTVNVAISNGVIKASRTACGSRGRR